MTVEIKNEQGHIVGLHDGQIYQGDTVALLEASELLDQAVRDKEEEQS